MQNEIANSCALSNCSIMSCKISEINQIKLSRLVCSVHQFLLVFIRRIDILYIEIDSTPSDLFQRSLVTRRLPNHTVLIDFINCVNYPPIMSEHWNSGTTSRTVGATEMGEQNLLEV